MSRSCFSGCQGRWNNLAVVCSAAAAGLKFKDLEILIDFVDIKNIFKVAKNTLFILIILKRLQIRLYGIPRIYMV